MKVTWYTLYLYATECGWTYYAFMSSRVWS